MAVLPLIIRRQWVLAAICGLLSPAAVMAVRPSFAKAEALGFELQRQFSEVKSEAIVSRLDRDRIFHRVFAPLGGNTTEDRDAKRFWCDDLFPAVTNDLKSLDGMATLMFSRVLLLGDGRYLETLLFSKEGRFHILRLRLAEEPDGTIVIEDFQMSGTLQEFSQTTRCMLLLLGAGWYRPLEEEEMLLGRMSASVRLSAIELFKAIGDKRLDDAYRVWARAPDALRETRYWRGLRTRLAFLGSQAAGADLRAACLSGAESDTVLRLSVLGGDPGGFGQALALVDDARRTHFDMPYLRVVKAEALLTAQRPEEAWRETQEVMRLNPYCLPAYLIGTQAALKLDRSAQIPPILTQWASIVPVTAVEEVLNLTPVTAQFLKSKTYTEWREAQVKKTAPVPPSARPGG